MRTSNELSPKEQRMLQKLLCEKSGYHLRSPGLLRQAFTRSSYSARYGGRNNEILEFLGDQVLGMYVVRLVADRCGARNHSGEYAFRIREDRFSAIKQELVSNEALARIIDDWGLAEYLIVDESDIRNQVDQRTKVKADLFEAILGAIAVECDWDCAVLAEAVRRMTDLDARLDGIIESDCRRISFDAENAVTVLKELAETGLISVPKYEYVAPEQLGHTKNGDPRWCCTCTILNDKTGIIRQVWGSSKKLCKKYAAYLVLCEHFEVQNRYGGNSPLGIWTYRDGALIPGYTWEE